MMVMIGPPATQEQIEAARETVRLVEKIEDFIEQSKRTEKNNQRLTVLVVGLSIIQVVVAIISITK